MTIVILPGIIVTNPDQHREIYPRIEIISNENNCLFQTLYIIEKHNRENQLN